MQVKKRIPFLIPLIEQHFSFDKIKHLFPLERRQPKRQVSLTILPVGVLNGHADEYSKPVLGRITGCSPITPIPLQ